MFREVQESDWSRTHLVQHGVTPEEVRETALSRPCYVTCGRKRTRIVYGRTNTGRHLFIVIAKDHSAKAFAVTARDFNIKERRLFNRKAR